MIMQLFFGWPMIVLFILLATYAVWTRKISPMIVAALLSIFPSFYLFSGEIWIRLLALYIPISLCVCVVLMGKKMYLFPRILLFPIYGFYGWLATAVITQ